MNNVLFEQLMSYQHTSRTYPLRDIIYSHFFHTYNGNEEKADAATRGYIADLAGKFITRLV